jgi:hypothetical protein
LPAAPDAGLGFAIAVHLPGSNLLTRPNARLPVGSTATAHFFLDLSAIIRSTSILINEKFVANPSAKMKAVLPAMLVDAVQGSFPASANVSGTQRHNSARPGLLRQALEAHAVDPAAIELELTDTFLLENAAVTPHPPPGIRRGGDQHLRRYCAPGSPTASPGALGEACQGSAA